MIVRRSETSVLRDISAVNDAYKHVSESKEALLSGHESKSVIIPDDDAATATIQSSPAGESTAFLQDSFLVDAESGGKNKIISKDLGVLKKLKEMIEKLNSSDFEKKILTEDSELLKKIEEMIERINSSEWSMAGIRELIDHFSTTNQFDLQEIQRIEQYMKDLNMNLEIGEFSLCRILEKAYARLKGEDDTDADDAAGLLGLLKRQEAEEEKRAMQSTVGVSDGNTYNTFDSEDAEGNDLLNVEA